MAAIQTDSWPGAERMGDAAPVLRELACARRRQLDFAMQGEIITSARYAEYAEELRGRISAAGL